MMSSVESPEGSNASSAAANNGNLLPALPIPGQSHLRRGTSPGNKELKKTRCVGCIENQVLPEYR